MALITYSRDTLRRQKDPSSNIRTFCQTVSLVLELANATQDDNAQTPYVQLRRLINDNLQANITEAIHDPMHFRSFPQLCGKLYDWHEGRNLMDEPLVRTLVEAWDSGTEFWSSSESMAYRRQLESLRGLAKSLNVAVDLPNALDAWERLHRPKMSELKDEAYETVISDATSGHLRSAVRRSARRVVKQSYLCAV